MAFPIRVCAICSEEFELRPDKPGFANRCPTCSLEDAETAVRQGSFAASDDAAGKELNEARRRAMRELLYRKDV